MSAGWAVCEVVSVSLLSIVLCFSCLIVCSVLYLSFGSCLTCVLLCVLVGVGGVISIGVDVLLVGVVGVVGGVMRSMQGVDFRKKILLSFEVCVMLLMIKLSA